MGIILMTGAGVALSDASRADNAFSFISGAVINLFIGLDALIVGILCISASKKSSKAMPVLVLSAIGILLALLSMVSGIMHSDISKIGSGLTSCIVDGILFYLANVVRKGDTSAKTD